MVKRNMKFLKIDNNKKEKENFIMKDKEIMKINLVDADYGSSSVGIIVVAKGSYNFSSKKTHRLACELNCLLIFYC